jgi:hypothetical protein
VSLIAMGRWIDGGRNMPQVSRGVLSSGILGVGVFAAALTFGAVQFASGRDLSAGLQEVVHKQADASRSAVNRSAKADRAAGAAELGMQMQTISIQLNGFSDTSFLVRIAKGARTTPAAPLLTSPSDGKLTVACEPVVSILSEVVKQLQPGRCVT